MNHKLNPHLRWQIRRDLPQVLAIENASFSEPWTEEDFLSHARQRNEIQMVAELKLGEHEEPSILGYYGYSLQKTRIHIINFAVHPEYRRRGVGAAMVQKLLNKLCPGRRNRLTLDIGERNTSAHLFFKAMGFEAVAVKRGFFPETGEDAYRFCLRLSAFDRTSSEGEPAALVEE